MILQGSFVQWFAATSEFAAEKGLASPSRSLAHASGWLTASLLGVVLIAVLAGAGQKGPENIISERISAKEFRVLGPKGKVVAMLHCADGGHARLAFLNTDGDLRLSVGVNPDGGPGIVMLDRHGKQRLRMSISDNDDSPGIDLFDENGTSTLSLSILNGFGPQLAIGRADKGRVTAGLSKQGEPSVLLWGTNNEPRLSLDVTNGAPVVKLLDPSKNARIVWKLMAGGSPSFSMLDSRSRMRLSLGADNSQKPYIHLIDPDLNTIKDVR